MTENTDRTEDSIPFEEKLRDQFLRAEHSTEADAAPRIEVSEHDGNVRVDVADAAAVRPGPGPGVDGADDPDEARDEPAPGPDGTPA